MTEDESEKVSDDVDFSHSNDDLSVAEGVVTMQN